MGVPCITGYEPIKDASGAIIGVYSVGYKKVFTPLATKSNSPVL